MKQIQESMHEVIEAIKNPIPGIPLGLPSVTRVTGGAKPGQLIIVAGRSSMGKSALAGDILLSQPGKVLFFSLEMSSIVLIQRLIANRSNVNFRSLVDNKLNKKEHGRVKEAMKWLNTMPFFIDDTPCLTPNQFWEKSEKHLDASMIIIDHLHLMRHEDGRLSEVKALDEICQTLRTYAKTYQLPIVLLAQLNRNAEDRDNHKPLMADLRGSGGIEQDSDIVLLLYRPAYYMQKDLGEYEAEDDGDAEIIVAKQRNGVTGSLKAVFMGEFMSYRDAPQQDPMAGWRE
jgi:replicative DNA helicase